MRRIWLSLGLIVLGWDGLLPHIESDSPRLAALALMAGGLLLVSRRPRPPITSLAVALAGAGGAALSAALLPWPERLGPILLAAGFLGAALPAIRTGTKANIALVPMALGGAISVSAALGHVYRHVEAMRPDLGFMARPIALLYRTFGVPAAADHPFVHLQGVGNVVSFDCSLEKLVGSGLAIFMGLGFGTLFVVRGRRIGWRAPLLLSLVAFLYLVARTLVLGLVLDEVTLPAFAARRFWAFGSLLPLVGLLAAVIPPLPEAPPASRAEESPARPRRRALTAFALAVLAGVFAAGTLGWFDPGQRKPGRVLIDEKHSNWEWSTLELNTQSYGVQTVYNYSELVRYLRHYYDVTANFEPLDDDLLAGTDVVILKTPTRPYAEDEVDALVRFVERGGGLWLIGDHTNVFGMSTNLNKVARRFGMRYRFDAVIDLLTFGRQLFQRPRWFAHPSLRHLPPILMATSSSMVGPVRGRAVMVGRSLLSDHLDYSTNSFFGDFFPDSNESFGSTLQAAAVTHGRGRVLGFSDSTIFSNFFMFIRGKPELALGSVAWLMHENRWGWVPPALLIGALGFALAFALVALRTPRELVIACLVGAGLPAFAITARGLDAWVENWSRLPEPRQPLPIVSFDRGRTAYHVPDIAEMPDRSPFSFHTFYVWTQRVGYMPTTRLFEKCLDDSRIVVFINPRGHFESRELADLASWVENGGALLVMDSPHSRHTTANVLLRPFGLAFQYSEMESTVVVDAASADTLATLAHVGQVQGGDPVWLRPDGGAALSRAQSGRGRVVAMCASDSFSDAVLGTTSEVPNRQQLALYQLQFRLFDEILRTDGERAERPPASDRRAGAAAP